MGIQDLRDRLRASEAEHRRTYMPPADSPIYKSYRWWKQETGYSVARENFCHFWRVVLIWAPLLLIRQKLAGPVSKSPVQTLLTLSALGVLQAVLAGVGLWPLLPVILGVGLIIAGFVAGCALEVRRQDDHRITETISDIAGGSYFSLGAVLMYLTFPIMTVAFCIAFVVSKFFDAVGDYIEMFLGILMVTGLGAISTFAIISMMKEEHMVWWTAVLLFVGGLVAVFAAVGLFVGMCFGINKLYHRARKWSSMKLEQRRVHAPGTVDGQVVPREPNAFDRAKQRIKDVLTTVWHVIRLAAEAVWVAKALAVCPYVDMPESEPETALAN